MHRQRGQVYYFPLRHLDGWSKWLSEVGEFHTFFEYVLYFVPFCTMQPFLPSVLFFGAEKMEARANREAGEKCHLVVSECFSRALIHLCQQHVFTFLFFPTAPRWCRSPLNCPLITLLSISCKSHINHNKKWTSDWWNNNNYKNYNDILWPDLWLIITA